MLTLTEIERLLRHYELGTVVATGQAGHGLVNETSFVRTSRGGLVVVRRNQRRVSEASRRYVHSLMNTLLARGFPAPPLIPARSGDTLITLDGRLYEVHGFVEGHDYDASRPAQVTTAGIVLARYHLAVAGCPPPPGEADQRYSPQTITGLTERLFERDVMGELHSMLSWYDMRAATLRTMLSPEAYAALPHLVIHGDVHSDNFRFQGDEAAALLDYDQAIWDARLADVADALVAFATGAGPQEHTWGVFRGPLDEQRAEALIAGYCSVNPLEPAELAALPVLVEVLWLRGELGRVFATPEGAPDYHDSVLAQGRMLTAWMETHRSRLVGTWQALTAQPPIALPA